jgi:hypothetical protein
VTNVLTNMTDLNPIDPSVPGADEPEDAGAQDAYADGTPEPLRILEEILNSIERPIEHAVPTPEKDPDNPEF